MIRGMPNSRTGQSGSLTDALWKRSWKPHGINLMKRARIILPVCVLACGSALRADNPAASQEFQRSYALSPHGRIRIENRYGNVRITAWDRDEVRIDAVKSAADEDRLADANIVVDSTAEQLVVR